MFDIVNYLGIYPDTIQENAKKVDSALQEAGATIAEIDQMYDNIKEHLESGDYPAGNFTNALIADLFSYAAEILKEKLPGISITYYINCDDSHFYVNGEEYYKGDDVISRIRSNMDAVEVVSTEEISLLNGNTAYKAHLSIDDADVLCELLVMATDEEGIDLADIYNKETEYLLEEIYENKKFLFDAAIVLAENGARWYEIKLTEKETGVTHICTARLNDELDCSEWLDPLVEMAVRTYCTENSDETSKKIIGVLN